MSLMEIFREVQMQAGFMFVFQPTLVDQFDHLAVPGGTHSVQEFLEIVLRDTPVGFEENGRNIIIFRRPVTFNIQGRVLDPETEEGLPGVTIYIKDSNKGTHSEPDGSFAITATKDEILVFSYVGRITKQVTVNEHTPKKIVLQPMTLPEVMVHTGYYDVPEPERIGNISTITHEKLERTPVITSLQSLQGRLAGVFVEQISGLHGSGYKIRIRGQNSLRDNGNEPLYIIDGVPYPSASMTDLRSGYNVPLGNSISLVPLSTIDQIDVLKDADATSIYGSRGANGVVLITTKRPIKSGTGAEVNINTGFSQVGHYMNLLNTSEWLEMRNEAHRIDEVKKNLLNAPDLIAWDTTRYTNWQKELIGGIAPVTNAVVSLYGGEELTKFFLTGNFYKEGSVFPKRFDYTRGSALFKMTHHSKSNRFHANMIFSYAADDNNLPLADITSDAFLLPPDAPRLYTSEGQLNWENDTWYNPLAYLERTYRAQTNNIITHAIFDYELLPGLVLKTSLGQTILSRKESVIVPYSSYSQPMIKDGFKGYNSWATNAVKTLIAEPILEYTRKIGPGNAQFLVGTTLQHIVQDGQGTMGSGYTNDALIGDIEAAPIVTASTPISREYKYAAMFGRLNYNWREKYILNLTARRDGSSRYGVRRAFTNFGSVGGAWIITKEPFTDNLDFLSFGKIRATYGITGNDQINDYDYDREWESKEISEYGGKSSLTSFKPPNALYTWENTKKFEIGLALGFWRNRVQLDLSYYRNRSSNQLVTQEVSTVTGFSSAQFNVPIVIQNSGFEMLLGITPIDGPHFSWTSSLNLTLPYNKLVEYDHLAMSEDSAKYIVGKPLTIKQVYKTSINPNTGQFEYADPNKNGRDRSDRYLLNTGVHSYGGLDNTIRFRNFQLDILVQFVKQTSLSHAANTGAPGGRSYNPSVSVLDRWKQQGDFTNIHRSTVGGAGSREYRFAQENGDIAYVDGSYLRFKNVCLAYSFNKSLTKPLNLKLYLQAQNLLTFTPFDGVDPETNLYINLPPLRTVVAGVHLTL
jgi:TonB-linked SusC/RagA family outer membrane protein